MKGLVLAALKKIAQTNSSVSHKFVFDTILNIDSASGITKLCSDFVFFLFSTYNPATGVGSDINSLIGAPILQAKDKNLAVVQIVDALEDAVERFKVLQGINNKATPVEELLSAVRIVSITVDSDKSEALIVIEIINSIDQRAHIQL